MSAFGDAATSDDASIVAQRERQFTVWIPGRFSLASKRDANGNRRQFACRVVNASQTAMRLTTPIGGPIGERVIAYFQELGKVQGSITQVRLDGFVIRIAASNSERSRLLRKLTWLEQNKTYNVPDMRRHKRFVPEDPISTMIFSDGSMLGCFVIDMSASGVAVSADITPEIGTVLAIGKVAGTVVRHFEEGFAIAFRHPQNTRTMERLLIHKF
jgi:hypothetical protein